MQVEKARPQKRFMAAADPDGIYTADAKVHVTNSTPDEKKH
jgi:hypothetical protein